MTDQAILKNLGISNLIVNTLYLLNHQRDNCPLRYLGVISLVLLKSVSSFHFAYNIALSQTLDLKPRMSTENQTREGSSLSNGSVQSTLPLINSENERPSQFHGFHQAAGSSPQF